MKKIFVLSVVCFLYCFSVKAKTVATIGDTEISSEDIKKRKKQVSMYNAMSDRLDDSFFLDQIINFKLAVMDAKKSGIENEQDAREAMDLALYNYYIFQKIDKQFAGKTYSNSQLKKYYDQNPLLKIKRLCIPFEPGNEARLKYAKARISSYRLEIKNGKKSMDAVILKLQNTPVSQLSGTFDKVNADIMHKDEATALRNMSPGEISPVLVMNGYVEILELVKRHPFSAVNKDLLKNRIQLDEMMDARQKFFETLRKKYKDIIQIEKQD